MMTSIFSRNSLSTTLLLPTPPSGLQIGSYATYADAQRAVEVLSTADFPVGDVTIVGVDLQQVERVTGRLTWPKVLAAGVVSGAWLGIFVGLVLGIFAGGFLAPLGVGLMMGIVFGVITTAVPYAATAGRRDFASTMQLVARRYDVLCESRTADEGRNRLARNSFDH